MIKILLAIYFFTPKFNLINIPGFVTGIRLDDIAVLGIIILFALKGRIPRIIKDRLIFFYLLPILFAFLVNIQFISLWNLLSFLRVIEYVVVSIAVYHFLNFKELIIGIKAYLILNFIFCLGQIAFGFPGFASIGLIYDLTRLYGLTGGAWELGAFAAIAACLIAINDSTYKNSRPSYSWYVLCMALIILSSSRSQLLTLPFIFLTFLGLSFDNSFKNITRIKGIIYLLPVTIAGFFGIDYFFYSLQNVGADRGTDLVARSVELFSLENLTIFSDLINEQFIVSTREGIEAGKTWFVDYGSHPDADDSFLIRAYKWTAVVNILFQNPFYLIFGLGPGSLGDALDGGFLRSFAEYGFLMLLFYIELFRKFFRFKPWVLILMFFIPTMIFIDIHLSSKIQPLILAMALFSNKIITYSDETSN